MPVGHTTRPGLSRLQVLWLRSVSEPYLRENLAIVRRQSGNDVTCLHRSWPSESGGHLVRRSGACSRVLLQVMNANISHIHQSIVISRQQQRQQALLWLEAVWAPACQVAARFSFWEAN